MKNKTIIIVCIYISFVLPILTRVCVCVCVCVCCSVVVKVLQQFSRVISTNLLEPFRSDVWSKIFHTLIDFISQV